MRCALFSRFESIANCLISVHPCLFYSKTQMESKAFLWFNGDIKSFFSSITALSSGDVSVIKTSHPLGIFRNHLILHAKALLQASSTTRAVLFKYCVLTWIHDKIELPRMNRKLKFCHHLPTRMWNCNILMNDLVFLSMQCLVTNLSFLCPADERKSHSFGTTWRRVNDD